MGEIGIPVFLVVKADDNLLLLSDKECTVCARNCHVQNRLCPFIDS